ncbi:hypothetical protein CDAR_230071 [Caerostris darwini]|uniref:Uncharacterized protein n=1 Tax=Caerostris darwini TaxID=1538125 RepID=A0AAV4UHE7_9ARAC|nr:hypothetical protein CDAR_230071 [Caerostris darwini]
MLYRSGIQPGKDRTNSLALTAASLTAAALVKVISNKMKYCTNPMETSMPHVRYSVKVFRQQSNSSTGSKHTGGTEQSVQPSHPRSRKRKRAT